MQLDRGAKMRLKNGGGLAEAPETIAVLSRCISLPEIVLPTASGDNQFRL
jgi:hypothetical protein